MRRHLGAGLGVVAIVAAVALRSSGPGPVVVAAEPAPARPSEPPSATDPADAPRALTTSLIYSVYDPNGATTRFLRVDAGHAASPVELASATHAEGFPPRAALSADGTTLAYTRLPPGARRGAKAELVLVDLASGAVSTLADDAHYFSAPVFVPGALVYVRQTSAAEAAAPPESPKDDSPGAYQQLRTEVMRIDLRKRTSSRLFDRGVVSLQLLGAQGSTLYATLRVTGGESVVALDAGSGALREVYAVAKGRELAYASLDAGGLALLVADRRSGAQDLALSRLALRDGALQTLGAFPFTAPPAHLAGGLLVRAQGDALVLQPLASPASRALRGPRPGATDAGIEGLSTNGRYVVARWLAGATQVYALVDTDDGSMRPLPPPRGGDLHGMNAEVVGFTTASTSEGGAR